MKRSVHFIGIGGTGMAAAAGIALREGWEVRGSDGPLYPPMSDVLQRLEIPVYEGYSPENLSWNPDVVVVGNVCTKDHPEAVAAMQMKDTEVTSFPAFLEKYILSHRHPVVVAGTHGKTTTSTILAWLLRQAGMDPGYLIGGQPVDLEYGFATGSGDLFVLEGDEYDTAFFDKNPKFIHYRPKALQLTSVEYDHADIYPDMDSLRRAFRRLVGLLPPSAPFLVAAESSEALRLAAARPHETYGLEGEGADWEARNVERSDGVTSFTLYHGGAPVDRFKTRLIGDHNLRNVTGALAISMRLGAGVRALQKGLYSFRGVKRRQEVLVHGPVTVIDDFGHHPTAIEHTIRAIRQAYSPARLVAVFEPRSATSRRSVFQDAYARSLSEADSVIVASPYNQSKIPENERFSSARLVEDLKSAAISARLVNDAARIPEIIESLTSAGDVVVFFSSGSFGGAPKMTAERILEEVTMQAGTPV